MFLLEREVNIRAQEADSQGLQLTEEQIAAALGLRGLEYTPFSVSGWRLCLWQRCHFRDQKQRLPKKRARAGAEGKQSRSRSPPGNLKTESRREMAETWSLAGGGDRSRQHRDKLVKCPG